MSFSHCCLFAGAQGKLACVWALYKYSLGFPQPFSSSGCSPTGFQSQMLWQLLYLIQVTWQAVPNVSLGHLPWSSGRTSGVLIPFLPARHHTWGACSDWATSLPLLPISTCLFLYILSGRKAVLLVFGSFAVIVVLYVVVVLCVRGWRWDRDLHTSPFWPLSFPCES